MESLWKKESQLEKLKENNLKAKREIDKMKERKEKEMLIEKNE